jgi:sulfur-carrier protein
MAEITVCVLRQYSGAASELPLRADTVQAALVALAAQHPALHRNVCDETGAVRRHVNLFVNNDHMRERGGLDAPFADGDVLTILPAVSGG